MDVAYDVYMTLDGAGVGMRDGRWDYHLDKKSLEALQKHLGGSRTGSSQGVLGDAFNRVQEAIRDEAMRKCDRKSGLSETTEERIQSVYVTTYCNFAHDVKTGKPIEHECIIIPPKALAAEMAGDYEAAIDILENTRKAGKLRTMRRGVKEPQSSPNVNPLHSQAQKLPSWARSKR